jgi:glycosyltransferase involved in cell wall biosynthesis
LCQSGTIIFHAFKNKIFIEISTTAMNKRIFLVGSVFGSYRARALIEFLGASPKFSYFHVDPRFLTPKERTLLARILFRGTRIIDRLYGSVKLCLADIVYVLPMSNLKSIEWLIVKLFSKKVISEFYISMYDTYVNDRKYIAKESSKAKKTLLMDQKLIDYSSEIIFLNKSEQKYYLNVIGRINNNKNCYVIPLATSPKKKAIIPFVSLNKNSITLCWWGTFIPLHGLEKIIEAAKCLIECEIKFKMYLFGTSDELSKPYQRIIDENNLNNHVVINNTKHFSDRSLEYFLAENCDIAFGNFGDSKKAKTVMVNKVVEATSMGIPVISQNTAALEEYFTDNKTIFFAESTPRGIAQKVICYRSLIWSHLGVTIMRPPDGHRNGAT